MLKKINRILSSREFLRFLLIGGPLFLGFLWTSDITFPEEHNKEQEIVIMEKEQENNNKCENDIESNHC